jgi:drug/metabolite transporter (DMT)-like permease
LNPQTPLPKKADPQLTGIIFVLLGALSIGIMPSAAKIAYQDGANPMAAILLRSLVGLVGLAAFMLIRRIDLNFTFENIRKSSLTGVTQSLSSLGIMGSVAYIDVSLAVLIIFFFPFLVILFNHFRGQSRMTVSTLICFFVAVSGLGLALGVSLERLDATGVGLAVIGMVSMAVMVLKVSSITRKIGALSATLQMTAWTCFFYLVLVLLAPVTGWLEPASYPGTSLGWISILAAGVSFILGYVFFFLGADIIGSSRASMLSIAEPVFIVFAAIVLVDEWLSPLQWFGLVMVIGSLIVIELPKKSEIANLD